MNYTKEQLVAFKAEFQRKRLSVSRTFLVVSGLLLASLLVLVTIHILTWTTRGLMVYGAAVTTGFLFAGSQVRCPACNAVLWMKRPLPKCPKCGIPLDQNLAA
jgi:hypothetical protein